MSLSFTLIRNEKIEYYIRIKIHKFIVEILDRKWCQFLI